MFGSVCGTLRKSNYQSEKFNIICNLEADRITFKMVKQKMSMNPILSAVCTFKKRKFIARNFIMSSGGFSAPES